LQPSPFSVPMGANRGDGCRLSRTPPDSTRGTRVPEESRDRATAQAARSCRLRRRRHSRPLQRGGESRVPARVSRGADRRVHRALLACPAEETGGCNGPGAWSVLRRRGCASRENQAAGRIGRPTRAGESRPKTGHSSRSTSGWAMLARLRGAPEVAMSGRRCPPRQRQILGSRCISSRRLSTPDRVVRSSDHGPSVPDCVVRSSNHGLSTPDRVVRDLSADLTRLKAHGTSRLPDEFALEIPATARTILARVPWRRPGECGVRFVRSCPTASCAKPESAGRLYIIVIALVLTYR
jgi:hypothetical protein